MVDKRGGKNGKIKEKRASRHQFWFESQDQHFIVTLNKEKMLLF